MSLSDDSMRARQMSRRSPPNESPENRRAREEREAEEAEQASFKAELEQHPKEYLVAYILALRRVSEKHFASALDMVERIRQENIQNRRARRKGAAERYAKDADGKQAAIRESRKLWHERESGMHSKLGTEEQFALAVMRQWPVLGSVASIMKRSTLWRKQLRAERAER